MAAVAVAVAGIFNLHPPPPPPRYRFKISASINPSHCTNHSPSPNSVQLNNTLSEIQNSGIIACLRAPSAELALGAAHAALDNGISVLEVVVSSPGVFEVVQELVQQYPTKTIGIGTILNVEDAKRAIQSGVKFLMSPAMVQGVFENILGAEVLYIPGVMTPTEILHAHNVGAKIVKVYPVSAIGGIHYIRAIKKPFAHIPIIASQGITIDATPKYIIEGASAVVLSDAIFDKHAIAKGDLKTISKLASRATLIVNEAVKQSRLTKVV